MRSWLDPVKGELGVRVVAHDLGAHAIAQLTRAAATAQNAGSQRIHTHHDGAPQRRSQRSLNDVPTTSPNDAENCVSV